MARVCVVRKGANLFLWALMDDAHPSLWMQGGIGGGAGGTKEGRERVNVRGLPPFEQLFGDRQRPHHRVLWWDRLL